MTPNKTPRNPRSRLVKGSKASQAGTDWCFTYHLLKKSIKGKNAKSFLTGFKKESGTDSFYQYSKEVLISKETGKRGDTPHLQGFITFNRPLNLFNYKGKCIPNEIHLERMRGSIEDNIRYVCGIDKPWQKGKIVLRKGIPYLPKAEVDRSIIPLQELYDYQRKAYDIIIGRSTPRTIHWFWDTTGNTGKSSFCKTMVRMQQAFYLGDTGTTSDIHHAIRNAMENRNGTINFKKYPRAFVLDLSRTSKPNYGSIERIKNGLFFSPKYDSTYVYGKDYPSVVVFSNSKPDTSKLSLDRWEVYEILSDKSCTKTIV